MSPTLSAMFFSRPQGGAPFSPPALCASKGVQEIVSAVKFVSIYALAAGSPASTMAWK
jgi:hypothetical protein